MPFCRIRYSLKEPCTVTSQDLIHTRSYAIGSKKSNHLPTFTADAVPSLFIPFRCTSLPWALELTLQRFSSAPLLLYYYSDYSRFEIVLQITDK
jgi:hypothetical protein